MEKTNKNTFQGKKLEELKSQGCHLVCKQSETKVLMHVAHTTKSQYTNR